MAEEEPALHAFPPMVIVPVDGQVSMWTETSVSPVSGSE